MKFSTNRITLVASFMYALSSLMMVQVTKAMYFYAEQDQWRCF